MRDYSVVEMLQNNSKLKAKTKLLDGKDLPADAIEELEQLKVNLERLDICIESLQDEDAELIRKYFFQGLSSKKIIRQLAMSKSTFFRKKNSILNEIEANFAIFSKN